MILSSTPQTFRSIHLRWPMPFLSLNLYDTRELAPYATQTRIPRGMLEIVIQDVLWSTRGSFSAI